MQVGEHFVHLKAEHTEVQALQILTRRVAPSPHSGHILVGIDDDGDRHLLIPIPADQQLTPFAHKVISVSKREWADLDEASHYLDVSCNAPGLFLVFDRLAEEIVSRVLRAEGDPVSACMSTLDEWRAIIETASQPTSPTTVAGLVGELSLLEELAAADPVAALQSWTGPGKGKHDFVFADNSAIEIKATTSLEGTRVSISGLDQLDHSSLSSLHLAVYHLRKSPKAPTLDERIDRLTSLGIPKTELIQKVADAGYVYESSTDQDSRFEHISFRIWEVNDDFPGLKRNDIQSSLTHGVENVRFEILLDAAPAPLNQESARHLLKEWSSHE